MLGRVLDLRLVLLVLAALNPQVVARLTQKLQGAGLTGLHEVAHQRLVRGSVGRGAAHLVERVAQPDDALGRVRVVGRDAQFPGRAALRHPPHDVLRNPTRAVGDVRGAAHRDALGGGRRDLARIHAEAALRADRGAALLEDGLDTTRATLQRSVAPAVGHTAEHTGRTSGAGENPSPASADGIQGRLSGRHAEALHIVPRRGGRAVVIGGRRLDVRTGIQQRRSAARADQTSSNRGGRQRHCTQGARARNAGECGKTLDSRPWEVAQRVAVVALVEALGDLRPGRLIVRRPALIVVHVLSVRQPQDARGRPKRVQRGIRSVSQGGAEGGLRGLRGLLRRLLTS